MGSTLKRSAGVAPEMNLGIPLHTGNKVHRQGIHSGFETQGQTSPEVKNRGISGPTKGTYILQKYFKTTKTMRLFSVCVAGPWSECIHHTCGDGGLQRREVWCAHSSGWATLESNCAALHRPPTQQRYSS